MVHSILKSKPTKLFVILGGFFITNALLAEIIGVKIFSLEKTSWATIYPLTLQPACCYGRLCLS
jgi:hypothetical protein